MSKQKKQNSSKPAAVKDLPSVKPAYSWNKFIYIFLFLFAFLLYANTLNNGYAYDDYAVISGNKYTEMGFKGIPLLLTTEVFEGLDNGSANSEAGRYRPLSLVSYAVEHQFFGWNSHVSHFINAFIYGLIAFFLYRTLSIIIPAKPNVALVASLLFIAHPVHTEVVANIKSRDELFSFLGLIVMMLYLFKYVRANKVQYIVYGCIAYFFSLLSKENGVTFIAIIPMSLYFFTSLPGKKILYLTLPFFLVFTGYYFLRTSIVGSVGEILTKEITGTPHAFYSSLSEKLATIMCVLGKYLLLLFYPRTLSCDYNYNEVPVVGWGNWKAFVPLLLYLLITIYAIILFLRRWKLRKQDTAGDLQSSLLLSYGILFYIMTLFLVSNILFSVGAFMGERFLFLPSLGFCLVISVLINKATTGSVKMRGILMPLPTAIVLGVILVLFSIRTISRNPDWKNNLTLFGADVHNAPGCAKLHYDYGNELYNKAMGEEGAEQKQQDLSASRNETMRAIEIDPLYIEAYYNLGQIYQEEGSPDSCIYNLKIAVFYAPKYVEAYSLLGTAFGKMKAQYDSAIYYLKTAVLLDDKFTGAFENLGLAYAMKNDLDNAIPNLEKAVELQPQNARQLYNLSIIYERKGNKEKSKIYYDRALAIDSTLKK